MEKSDMEEGFIKEKEDIRRKFEVEFRRIPYLFEKAPNLELAPTSNKRPS